MGFWEDMDKPALYFEWNSDDSEEVKRLRAENERLRNTGKSIEITTPDDSRNYICLDCDYKWKTKKDFGVPNKCPSCSSNNILKYSEFSGRMEEAFKEYKKRKGNNSKNFKEFAKRLKNKLDLLDRE